MEPVSSFLDALIKLADRLINLEKTKLHDKQIVFKEIIKPIFEEMDPVASNYKIFFQKARQMVMESRQADLLKVATQLRSSRDSMVMARIKVVEAAYQIPMHLKDDNTWEFAFRVNDFFLTASAYHQERYQTPQGESKAITFIEYLEAAALHKTSKETILNAINGNLREIDLSWSRVVRSYNELKIQYTVPPEHITKQISKKHNIR